MKKFSSILLLASVASLVWVSNAVAQPAQVQGACNPECTIKVTGPELDLISEGLQTQPFGKVVPLINKLRDQIIAQQPKPPVAPTAPVEPKKE